MCRWGGKLDISFLFWKKSSSVFSGYARRPNLLSQSVHSIYALLRDREISVHVFLHVNRMLLSTYSDQQGFHKPAQVMGMGTEGTGMGSGLPTQETLTCVWIVMGFLVQCQVE
jgi:hypothetical protein